MPNYTKIENTGIVRKLDNLGRLVLPKELLTTHHIGENDMMEIFTDGNYILLKKHELSCVICGDYAQLLTFKDKLICLACYNEIRNFLSD